MSFSRYNPSDRYRRKSRQQTVALFALTAFLIASFGLGYWFGRHNFAARLDAQQREITDLEQESNDLHDQLTAAQTEAQTAVMRLKQAEQEIEQLVPSDGPLRELLNLTRERLSEGTSPERLAFVIKAARPPRNCTPPATKRLVVSTPAYKGSDSVISLDDGLITVTARGTSARNEDGQPEAWFDPGQPISVTFEKFGEEAEDKEHTLPFSTSMVVKEREYRLSLSAGARSFLRVTYDSCDYP